MLKKESISIITVTYNSEKYLEETIESVLKQIDYLFEYIIIDGKSKDRTINIIEKYIPSFNGKLKYISEPDYGIYDAMNKGIKLAQGEIIGLINSDDYYTQYALQEVQSILNKYPNVDCIYSDVYVINENSQIEYIKKASLKDLNKGMSLNHPTCFIKKHTYQLIGLYNTQYKIAADYDFALRMRKHNCQLYQSSKILSNYRDGGISVKNAKKGILDTFNIQKEYYGFLYASYIRLKASLRLLIKGKSF